MAKTTTPQLLSGARGIVSVTYRDDSGNAFTKTLAVALDISVNVRESVRETYVMGELNPVALDPVAIDVDCSIGRVIPVNRIDAPSGTSTDLTADASGTSLNPKVNQTVNSKTSAASAIQLGLEETINRILSHDTIDIEIKDKITGATIAMVKEARFAGRSISTGAGDVASERLNFVGIYDKGYGSENSATSGYNL